MKLFMQIFIVLFFAATSVVLSQNSVSQFRTYLTEKKYEQAGAVALQALSESPNDADLAESVGDVFFELEDYNKALNAYARAKEIDDENSNNMAKWAKTLTALDRPQEAIIELQKVLNKDKKNGVLLVALANAYLGAKDIKNAELQITNALSVDSKNPEVYSMRGNIYYNQSIWELARSSYEDALKYDANNVTARQNLAEVYWKLAVQASDAGEVSLLNEYLTRSLAECNTLVQNDPLDANSWRLKGNIHFNAEQSMEAAQSYNKFLELRPNNYKERWRLAELFAKGNNCENAIKHLDVVINSNHADITDSIKYQAMLYLGNCYNQTKNFPQAIEMFNKADSKQPLQPRDLRTLVISHMLATDTAGALAVFDRFIVDTLKNYALASTESVHHCDILLSIARIYNGQKRYEDVIRTVKAGLEQCPPDNNTPYSYYLMATAYFELKQIDSAMAALNKAIEINPNYYYAYILLGDLYFVQKNAAEGEKQFNFVIENAKTDPVKYVNEINTAYSKIASNKLDAKKYADLEKITKQWIELIPEKNEAGYLYHAVAYQGLGNQAAACRYYNEVLKINPENKTARDNKKALGC